MKLHKERVERFREQAAGLEPTQREVLRGVYWKNQTRTEVGRCIGVSGDRVRQLEATVLRKIRQRPEMREYYESFCYRELQYHVDKFNGMGGAEAGANAGAGKGGLWALLFRLVTEAPRKQSLIFLGDYGS